MAWFGELLDSSDGFPRPDWAAVEAFVYSEPKRSRVEIVSLWERIARGWLQRLADRLGADHGVFGDDAILVVASNRDSRLVIVRRALQTYLQQIRVRLPGIVVSQEDAKHVAILFSDDDTFYEYVSAFYPQEGEFPLSRVQFIGSGYRHLALSAADFPDLERSLAHELTRSCISHLPLPGWLESGIALDMQETLVSGSTTTLSSTTGISPRFWTGGMIEAFWSGEAFGDDDAAVPACCLAKALVHTLASDSERFTRFANAAVSEDAGNLAALAAYGRDLGSIVVDTLGPGEWGPARV